MSKRAHGRGAIAAIGLLVLFAGLVGGVVLWIVAARQPNTTAEGFARAAPGCTTTVTFSEAGEYYVFEELSGVVATVEGCEATTTPGQAFAFDIRPRGGQPIDRITDTSVSYDLDAGTGSSVARITIDAPGDYAVSVLGNDPAINAAIGDDPDEGVDRLRRGAIAAVIVGLVVGGLLLWLAGRRSRKAATFTSPVDPGWGVTERDRQRRAAAGTEWAAPTSGSQQVPVNPHQPDERRRVSPADPSADGVWASPPEPDLPEPVLAGSTPSRTVPDDDALHADRAGTDVAPNGESNEPDASMNPVELADTQPSDDLSDLADTDASDEVSDLDGQDGSDEVSDLDGQDASDEVSDLDGQDGSDEVSDLADQAVSDDVSDLADPGESVDPGGSDGQDDPTAPVRLGEVGDSADQIDSDERHDPNAAAEPEDPADDGS